MNPETWLCPRTSPEHIPTGLSFMHSPFCSPQDPKSYQDEVTHSDNLDTLPEPAPCPKKPGPGFCLVSG